MGVGAQEKGTEGWARRQKGPPESGHQPDYGGCLCPAKECLLYPQTLTDFKEHSVTGLDFPWRSLF